MSVYWTEPESREFVTKLNRDGVNNAAEALGISDKLNLNTKRDQITVRLTGSYDVSFKEIPSVSNEDTLKNIRDQLLMSFLQQIHTDEIVGLIDTNDPVAQSVSNVPDDKEGSVIEENATGGEPISNENSSGTNKTATDTTKTYKSVTDKPTMEIDDDPRTHVQNSKNSSHRTLDTVEVIGPDGVKYNIPTHTFKYIIQPSQWVDSTGQQTPNPPQSYTKDDQFSLQYSKRVEPLHTWANYDSRNTQHNIQSDYPRFANQRAHHAELYNSGTTNTDQSHNNLSMTQHQVPLKPTGTLPKRTIVPDPSTECGTPKFLNDTRVQYNANAQYNVPSRYATNPTPPFNQPPKQKDLSKIVANWKMSFDGDASSVDEFFLKIEEYKIVAGLENEELLRALPMLLTGTAKTYYRINSANWRSWEEAKRNLLAYYRDDSFTERKEDEIRERKQNSNESLCEFVDAMLFLFSQLPVKMTSERKIHRIFLNMKQEYRQQLYKFKDLEIDSFVREARHLSKCLGEKEKLSAKAVTETKLDAFKFQPKETLTRDDVTNIVSAEMHKMCSELIKSLNLNRSRSRERSNNDRRGSRGRDAYRQNSRENRNPRDRDSTYNNPTNPSQQQRNDRRPSNDRVSNRSTSYNRNIKDNSTNRLNNNHTYNNHPSPANTNVPPHNSNNATKRSNSPYPRSSSKDNSSRSNSQENKPNTPAQQSGNL